MSSPDIPENDVRLYVPETDRWAAHLKSDWDRVYCFGKFPGQDFHHLILHGELYLRSRGEETVYCLECALRQGIATFDRLFWQHRKRKSLE